MKESFIITGITCQSCVNRIEKKLSKLDFINELNVNLATNILTVDYDESKIDKSIIFDTVINLGYGIKENIEISSDFLDISGMTCQVCVNRIEKKIGKLDGIDNIAVNLTTNIAEVKYNKEKIKLSEIKSKISDLGYGAETHKEELKTNDDKNLKIEKKELINLKIAIGFAIPILYITMGHMLNFPLPEFLHPNMHPITFSLTQFLLSIPIVFVGKGFFSRGIKALKSLSPNMDSLIAIGTGAALTYSILGTFFILQGDNSYVMHLYYESADVIIALVMLGKFLEGRSKRKTSEAIKKLGNLRAKKANLIRNDELIEVDIDEISVSDLILVKPGEIIPSDGVIISGTSLVDESMLTGESIPVEKTINSKVIGGSINKNGSFTFRTEAIGKDTTLSKIIKLVEEAQGSKAPIAKLADKISAYFVPTVIGIATISSLLWYFAGINNLIELNNTPSIFALSIFIAVLVIACPCSLGLATPTAIMVGTGKGASEGILIKGGEPLETAYKVDTVVFDKTGTITEGKPKVTDIFNFGIDEDTLLSLVASSESHSEHPLGEAIVNFAKEKNVTLISPSHFKSYTGMGIETVINDYSLFIGNEKFLIEKNIKNIPYDIINTLSTEGKTPLLVSINDNFSGIIAVADVIKSDSKEAVNKLTSMGINVIMLTGDNKKTALAIGHEAGINEIIAEVLPHEKSNVIKDLQAKGKIVAMVGDGINDAPSLALANVGIAIGNGTDIAIESADIVLMKNSILDVPKAINLSRKTIANIKQNLFWAFAYNIIGIPVAAGILYLFGGPLLNPMIAGAAMAMSSVSVVTNALRLKNIKID
ncbi:MAG: copper-translocating P-type ATPase [Fusobacteriaceae bacterium]|nr:copper-translocating P-type ATPase [Fusobacteriaceae bacterium]MBP6467336.1 copper-translocating P-type ATPase [Fusobacteriaceae bacterium]MBP9596453.1 copper-translocating P-type ATPase [Fusobacteriaceae bacterium]MBU9917759.1 heavy metal translocating P-type ATPase [Fusobacteriaceae bacterium]